ncbi:class I SAM-dependent methyltransferase [Candidatus Thorarchaeota archaeon]|nr:MAG: class I SAM-dependent methyltransferase [Candidatus Thorarchaeota archaeon]
MMSDDPDMFRTPVLRIPLKHIPDEGRVLDIGGGGEGLVSRLEGKRVCAVDVLLNKIREARIYSVESQWIQNDARALAVRDRVFDTVTCWFSLSYLPEVNDKRQVLVEAHRVLKGGGLLSIIGMNIPGNTVKHVFDAEFVLPDDYVSKMSYAVSGGQEQTLEALIELGKETVFQIEGESDHGHWFELSMRKT